MIKFDYGIEPNLSFSYKQIVRLFEKYKFLMEDTGYKLFFSALDKIDETTFNDVPFYCCFPEVGNTFSIGIISTKSQFTNEFAFLYYFQETQRHSDIYKLSQKSYIFKENMESFYDNYDLQTCIEDCLVSLEVLNKIGDYYHEEINFPFRVAAGIY